MTIQEILGTNLQAFRQLYAFCKDEFSTENILFVEAVRQLQGLPSAFPWLPPELTTADKISYIYRRFIPDGADSQVNIKAESRTALAAAQAQGSLNVNSFDAARCEIERLIESDTVLRFGTKAGIQITTERAAAAPAVAAPVLVRVVVPPSAPVLHLAAAPEPPDPDRHLGLDPPPPNLHNQIGPPPNAPAVPQTPPQGSQLLRAHKPGPHLRKPAPASPQAPRLAALQTPPQLPPPRIIVLANLEVPPQPPPPPRMVVRNVYVVNNT